MSGQKKPGGREFRVSFGSRYKILERLNGGSSGETYLVKDRLGGKKFIKRITSDAVWTALTRRSEKLMSLDHENLSKIRSIGEINGYRCVVEDYLPGCDLTQFVKENDFCFGDFITILEGVASALQYLKGRKLSHKDVKPSNILYDQKRGRVWLADLDYAAADSSDGSEYFGTVKFSAPEQLLYNETSVRSDIYSLGVTLLSMLAGDVPFSRDLQNRQTLLADALSSALLDSRAEKAVKRAVISVLAPMLEYDPAKRTGIKALVSTADALFDKFDTSPLYDTVLRKAGARSAMRELTVAQPMSVIAKTVLLCGDSTTLGGTPAVPENEYEVLLQEEYRDIGNRVRNAHRMWIASVILCFVIIFFAMYLILKELYVAGVIVGLLDAFVAAIQKMLKQDEEQYSREREEKMKHLRGMADLQYVYSKASGIPDVAKRNSEAMKLLKKIREINQ